MDPVVSQYSVNKEIDANIDENTDNNTENPIRQWQISKIKQMYLTFCIELLNQIYHAQKYKNILIYAMTVLEYREFG